MKQRIPKDRRSQELKDAEAALNSAVVRGEPVKVLERLRKRVDKLQGIAQLGPISDAIKEFANSKRKGIAMKRNALRNYAAKALGEQPAKGRRQEEPAKRKPKKSADGFSVEARFKLERETPGALRYEEVDDSNRKVEDGKVIGTLYLRKSSFKGMYPPKIIVVTIAAK